MRSTTVLEIPAAEQEALLRELRQGRYGHLLAIHILLLSAAGKNPTEIADFLFCSRPKRLSLRQSLSRCPIGLATR